MDSKMLQPGNYIIELNSGLRLKNKLTQSENEKQSKPNNFESKKLKLGDGVSKHKSGLRLQIQFPLHLESFYISYVWMSSIYYNMNTNYKTNYYIAIF